MNPNYEIFHVPTQEGSSEEDSYCASIGDAVQQHVNNLNDSERQLWEELIHTGDGNLFRIVPSLVGTDEEAIDEEERKRKEESEDVLDQCELVPYSEWEKFPQMWNTIDIPNTPKDKLMYCGNTKQLFYDVFPEGHPNAIAINEILTQVRARDPHDIDDGYQKWLIGNIYSAKLSKNMVDYVVYHLERMVNSIVQWPDHSEEFIIAALKCIDGDWGREFRQVAIKKFIDDPMYRLLMVQGKSWEERYKQGESVYSDVKTFGQLLYSDPTLRAKMNSALWREYKKLKEKFSPKVVVRGIDINRCWWGELRKAFNCSNKEARSIWHARPFESLADAYQNKIVNKKHFGGTKDVDKVIDWIEQAAVGCKTQKNAKALKVVSEKMTTAQESGKLLFSEDDWRMMWVYLRICKQEVLEHINGKGE